MRRALLPAALALALAAAAALAPAGASASKQVRVFAVGPKVSLDWLDTRRHFRDKLLALVDAGHRGPGIPSVQRGAGDVASHLRRDRSLVVLPEDLGLVASLTGSRGAAARRTPPSEAAAQQAIAALLGPYAGPIAYYQRKYPSLGARGLPVRALSLALTDTFARTAIETYATIARRYGVYLEAGIDVARSWRVVCTDRATYLAPPGAGACAEVNPGKVRALGDPDEPQRNYAYEATTPDTVNMALVFSPRGKIISKQVKAYLTPIELPGNLDLKPGDVDGVGAVRTAVGTLGFVTSKDAWMPDVTAKLDARGVDLLVQPEFFVGDTLRTTGMWSADTLRAAGYADLLRHPSFQAMVLPEMTGNFFSFPADAQEHIAIKPRGRSFPHGFLAGQPGAPGLATVQPYVVGDPLRPGESYAARRQRLGRAGERLLPGGPACRDPQVAGPCANGMREGTIWRDVTVGRAPRHRPVPRRKRGRTPFGVARPLSASGARQRNVDLAARGSLVAAAFEEAGRPVVKASPDGGRTWGRRRLPAGRKVVHGWWPQVAIGPDRRVWVTWQQTRGARPRVYVAQSGPVPRAGSLHFSRPRAVSAVAAAQWRPTIAAPERDRAVVAWIDERERSADDALPQAHVFAARVAPGRTGAVRRLDTGAPVTLAQKLDHSWAPDLVRRGRRLLLSFLDFRTYDWRVYTRASGDAGSSWAPQTAVTDTPAGTESLDDTPRGAFTSSGPVVAWTDFRKRASSARVPHSLYDIAAARPGAKNVLVDRPNPLQSLAFAPAVAADGAHALVAWQDMAAGPGRILLTRIDARGRPGGRRRIRVDDGGAQGWNAWRPALATVAGGRVLAAWEDERDGPPQIFVARAAVRALR